MHWMSQAWLGLLLDASLKSLLLAAMATTFLRLMRIRNVDVRHRVWTATLVSMLVLPWLVHATPSIPLPTGSLSDFAAVSDTINPSANANDRVGRHDAVAVPGESRSNSSDAVPFTAGLGRPTMSSGEALADASQTTAITSSQSDAAPRDALATAASPWPILVTVGYATVALAFLLRLLRGVMLTRQLAQNSRILDASELRTAAMCHGPVGAEDASRVALLESRDVRVPMTIGFRSPKILLPQDWRSWSSPKLRAVIAHEMAHIRRADYLVNLLAEANRCLYWFHPLAWLLRRWLAELAEVNCDDAVIASTGDRPQYARHLLEVAGALTASSSRVAWPAATMARKPSVETRIDAILDAGRPLASRVGVLGMGVLLTIAIPTVLVAAALRPGPTEQPEEKVESPERQVTDAREAATIEASADEDAANVDVRHTKVGGMVFVEGQRGKLPSGLRLFKSRAHLGNRESDLVELPESTVSEEGSFSVELENFPRNLDEGAPADRWIDFGVLITAPGCGLGWTEHQDLATGQTTVANLALKLVTDDVPIRGRILDSEGRPVNAARVRVGRIDASAKGSLDDWLKALRRGESSNQVRKHLGRSISFQADDIPLVRLGLSENVETDSQGRFEIRGVGRERIATLIVEGPTISRSEFRVATRTMPTVEIVAQKTGSNSRTNRVYGASADLVTMPALRIEGAVRDAATGKPLAGVTVRTSQLNGVGGAYFPAFKAVTDAKGHYQIDGFPLTGDHRILAVPADDQPYFMREATVPPAGGPGATAVQIDFELHRGIWITGRVTDGQTGTPIQAALHYLPFLNNKYTQQLPEFTEYGNGSTHFTRHQHRYQTDAEGQYRLVGLPGRAIVGVDAYATFRVGVGADEIDGLNDDGQFETYHNPIQASLGWPTAMKEIDPDKDATEVRIDFELQCGERQQVRVLGPQGHAISEVHVAGLNPSPNVDFQQLSLTGSNLQAVGLAPTEKRTLLLFRRGHNHAGITQIDMLAERPEVLMVKLKAGGSIMGWLLDEQGEPLSATTVEAWTQVGGKGVRLPGVVTDNTGGFLCKGVPAPWKYDLRVDGHTIATDLDVRPGVTLRLDDLQIGQSYSGARSAASSDAEGPETPEARRTGDKTTLRS